MRPIADAMRQIGSQMEALGRDQLRFGQRRYDETMPFYQQMVQANLEGQRMSMQLARDANMDRQKFRALEDEMVSEAMNQDRTAVRNQFAGRAASDVEQATSAARSVAARNLSRMGINPNAARFADLNNQITLGTAAARAGAMNNARMAADQVVDAKRMNAISLGRNLPATQLSAIGTGSNVGNSNANLFNAQNAPMFAGFQGAMGGLQGALGAQSGIANVMNQGYQNQLAAYEAEGGAMAGLGSLIGAGVGMWTGGMPLFGKGKADGGSVDGGKNEDGSGGKLTGPGTGTSDSIQAINMDTGEPIRLSNGEYILPADTVRKVGKKALDELVDETHKPVRKSAIRRA
jgi:hypothetical protein